MAYTTQECNEKKSELGTHRSNVITLQSRINTVNKELADAERQAARFKSLAIDLEVRISGLNFDNLAEGTRAELEEEVQMYWNLYDKYQDRINSRVQYLNDLSTKLNDLGQQYADLFFDILNNCNPPVDPPETPAEQEKDDGNTSPDEERSP